MAAKKGWGLVLLCTFAGGDFEGGCWRCHLPPSVCLGVMYGRGDRYGGGGV